MKILPLVTMFLLFSSMGLSADFMREHEATVGGVRVMFVLHPNMGELSTAARDVPAVNVSRPNDAREFTRAIYDYKEGWKLSSDGTVKAIGTLMRRGPKHTVPFDDIDRVIPFMKSLGAEGEFTKVQVDGRTWLRRVWGSPATALRGSRYLEWRVALSADLLIIFRVQLEDFTAYTGKPARWRVPALQMQERIFGSFRIE